MYKIMLADDEGIVIESLKFIIEKEFGDECTVEYAKTGRSVIELAETFRPDIAVMDIQMPGINGIEAMKEIRKNNNNVIFIVMSAYDKFDYAKESIKLKVMEYISKPMERTKIVAALKQAMAIVDEERKRRSADLINKEKMETVIPIIENGLIYSILMQDRITESIDNYKTMLSIEEDKAYMLSLLCGDEQQGSYMTNAVGSSVKLYRHYQEIRSLFKEYFHAIVGSVMGNSIAVMVPFSGESDYNERIERIDKARELVRELRRKLDLSCRIGIGREKEWKDLSDSYQEALSALAITTGSVAHVEDLPIGCEYETDYPIDLENKLFEAVEHGDLNNAVTSARQFFDWMTESNPESMMEIRTKTLEFVLWAEHLAYEKGGMVYRFKSRQDYLPFVMTTQELSALWEWFSEKISAACRNVINKRAEKSNSIIETAKEYLKQNYTKDLSLDDVSRVVNISPYYFSKLFKEDTGENFIEYLTAMRINKAKELLDTSDCSMKEICAMVGYSDPNYFSRAFKKNVGVTPTEYKEGRTRV